MISYGNEVDIDHNPAAVRVKVKSNRVKARQIDQCEFTGTPGDLSSQEIAATRKTPFEVPSDTKRDDALPPIDLNEVN